MDLTFATHLAAILERATSDARDVLRRRVAVTYVEMRDADVEPYGACS